MCFLLSYSFASMVDSADLGLAASCGLAWCIKDVEAISLEP